jgi:hypothetical protein
MPINDYKESSKEEKRADLLDSVEKYRVILEINNAIISKLKLQDLFQATAKAIRDKLSFDAAGIVLYEPVQDVLQLYAFEAFFLQIFLLV